MDTSEQYIRMCERAEEIQKLDCNFVHSLYSYSPECGTCPKHKWIEFGKYCRHCGSKLKPHKMYETREGDSHLGDDVWLPRQDQLQEIVLDGTSNIGRLINPFHNFAIGGESVPISPYPFSFTSMEQLWLAFVMKEKYGKVWTGEEWLTRG